MPHARFEEYIPKILAKAQGSHLKSRVKSPYEIGTNCSRQCRGTVIRNTHKKSVQIVVASVDVIVVVIVVVLVTHTLG